MACHIRLGSYAGGVEMPACCCPVHAGQAGLVIGDMHGLYVHTHTHTHMEQGRIVNLTR